MADTQQFGGHIYSKRLDPLSTHDCHHGCGCWISATDAGGPAGVDPFGDCPKVPKGDLFDNARFNGHVYDPEFDQGRLTGQIKRVHSLMIDGGWRTLDEIADTTGDPPASVSAQLRHLRKERFGSHNVDKRARGARENGLWEYRLTTIRSMKT